MDDAPVADVGVPKEKLPGAAGCVPNAENPVVGALAAADEVVPTEIARYSNWQTSSIPLFPKVAHVFGVVAESVRHLECLPDCYSRHKSSLRGITKLTEARE